MDEGDRELQEYEYLDDLADIFPWLPRGQYKRVKKSLPCSEQKSDKPKI